MKETLRQTLYDDLRRKASEAHRELRVARELIQLLRDTCPDEHLEEGGVCPECGHGQEWKYDWE